MKNLKTWPRLQRGQNKQNKTNEKKNGILPKAEKNTHKKVIMDKKKGLRLNFKRSFTKLIRSASQPIRKSDSDIGDGLGQ